jgi:hypothetical protein
MLFFVVVDRHGPATSSNLFSKFHVRVIALQLNKIRTLTTIKVSRVVDVFKTLLRFLKNMSQAMRVSAKLVEFSCEIRGHF